LTSTSVFPLQCLFESRDSHLFSLDPRKNVSLPPGPLISASFFSTPFLLISKPDHPPPLVEVASPRRTSTCLPLSLLALQFKGESSFFIDVEHLNLSFPFLLHPLSLLGGFSVSVFAYLFFGDRFISSGPPTTPCVSVPPNIPSRDRTKPFTTSFFPVARIAVAPEPPSHCPQLFYWGKTPDPPFSVTARVFSLLFHIPPPSPTFSIAHVVQRLLNVSFCFPPPLSLVIHSGCQTSFPFFPLSRSWATMPPIRGQSLARRLDVLFNPPSLFSRRGSCPLALSRLRFLPPPTLPLCAREPSPIPLQAHPQTIPPRVVALFPWPCQKGLNPRFSSSSFSLCSRWFPNIQAPPRLNVVPLWFPRDRFTVSERAFFPFLLLCHPVPLFPRSLSFPT